MAADNSSTPMKSPPWLRMAQIGLGIVILILSIIVLINPLLGSVSVILFLAFLLLFAGIEKIIGGIIFAGRTRFVSIGLGILVVIVAMIALAYPLGASIFVVLLLGVALLIDGISRIIHSIKDHTSSKWSKYFGVGVGILSIILAAAVIAYPGIGLAIAGVLIGIALLITSVQIISAGITGKNQRRRLI